MLGHDRHASETQFKWRTDDRRMLVVFGSTHQLKKQEKQMLS